MTGPEDFDPEEAHELAAKLERAGVTLRLDEGELVVEGTVGALSRKRRDQLQERRLDLIAHLEHKRRGLRDPEGVRRLAGGTVLTAQRPIAERPKHQQPVGYSDWW